MSAAPDRPAPPRSASAAPDTDGPRRAGSGDARSDRAGTLPFVQLFTDGACRGNPGPGGWAYILRHPASGT